MDEAWSFKDPVLGLVFQCGANFLVEVCSEDPLDVSVERQKIVVAGVWSLKQTAEEHLLLGIRVIITETGPLA